VNINWWAFGFGIGAVSMVALAFHPFVTYPLSLWAWRALMGRCQEHLSNNPDSILDGEGPCKISIVFCAYNEAAVIESKLHNLLDLVDCHPGWQIELLAYCDASTDGTARILQQYDDRVQVICGSVRRGKSHGMNMLLARATGDLVVFTDANVLLDRQVIPAFVRAFADPAIGVICGHLQYVNNETATAGVGTDYWRMEEWIKQLETDTGSTMGADGSIFAIRRKLWTPVPEDIIDDFYTSMRILCAGHRVVRCAGAIAYERSIDACDQEQARKTRIACRAYNCHRYLAADRRRLSWWNKYKYISHKWLRWQTFTWLMLAMICGVSAVGIQYGLGPAAAAVGLAGGGMGMLWVGQWLRIPAVGRGWVVLISLWATQWGVWQAWRGLRYQTWTPAQSARVGLSVQGSAQQDGGA
jgi:cellulose synthase/poly-beta-1,6-N-acetylglucosamine synthase-like glycosyltransferase